MERSLLTLLSSFLGFTALGFVSASGGSGSLTPPSKYEGDWRLLEPITYENLTVFPVVSSGGYDTSQFLTLEEGLSSGEIIVREQGAEALVRSRDSNRQYVQNSGPSVNQLVLLNRGKRPLLLLSGELVSGGEEDRVIAKDRIVAPGSEPLPLNVFCVEHGRWSQGANFTAAKTIVHPSVREQAAMKQNQSDVWASVSVGSTAPRPAAAPPPRVSTGALSAAMAEEAPTQS